MPLQVIGAGYSRTGTHSLYLALEKLGYCTMHMVKLTADPTQDFGLWSNALQSSDQNVDWEEAYGKYDAAVDIPTCIFYKELSERYPDAKVILTRRDADSWYKSVENTIARALREDISDMPEHRKKIRVMTEEIMVGGAFAREPGFKDKKAMCELYDKHNEEVIKTIPSNRLLIMDLGDGWEKLCKFLDKHIPNEPYPISNSTKEFPSILQSLKLNWT